MVERLFKLKRAIEQIVVDPNWTIFVNTLLGTHHQKLFIKAKVIHANIKKKRLLGYCANFVHIMEPILVSLRPFDGKQPCMGRV
jgi:hypothetical protein